MGAAVEEGEQRPARAVVGGDAGVRGSEVRRVEKIRLRGEGRRGEDEVLGDHGELVQHEVVRGRERGYDERRRGVLERVVRGLVSGVSGVSGVRRRVWFGFVGERGREAELKLWCRLRSVSYTLLFLL